MRRPVAPSAARGRSPEYHFDGNAPFQPGSATTSSAAAAGVCLASATIVSTARRERENRETIAPSSSMVLANGWKHHQLTVQVHRIIRSRGTELPTCETGASTVQIATKRQRPGLIPSRHRVGLHESRARTCDHVTAQTMTSHGERGKLATCAWFTREQRPLYTTGLAGNMTPSQSMAASSDWVGKDRSFSAPCLLIPSVFASARR